MNDYLKLLIEGMVLITYIVIVLWIVLLRFEGSRKLSRGGVGISSEELEGNEKMNGIRRFFNNNKRYLHGPVSRLNENYKYILMVYKKFNEEIPKKYALPAASEWLLDNFYIIDEEVQIIKRDLDKRSYLRLPTLKSGPSKGHTRIYAMALDFVERTNGLFDGEKLLDFLEAYQSHDVLLEREIIAMPMMMKLAIIEKIKHLCEDIQSMQIQWHKADKIFDEWLSIDDLDTGGIIKLFRDNLETIDEANPDFIDHFFYHLRRSGRSYAGVLRVMDEILEKLGSSTEIITQNEHDIQSQKTVSMSNCITSLHFFSTLDWSEIFESASFVEQILKQDPDGTYPGMDATTRYYYKNKVEELALSYGVSELDIANLAIEIASDAYTGWDKKKSANTKIQRTWHVGYYLIDKGIKILETRQKKTENFLPAEERMLSRNKYGIVYIGSVGLITIIQIAIAIQYSMLITTSNALFFSLLAAIAVLIPASEIAVKVLNLVICHALKPSYFSKLELKEGIPESLSTIIAMPTLISDKEHAKEHLEKLENHYLSNREENLYFALIGAFSDSDDGEIDDEIINATLSGVKELNSKYAKGHVDKFYFFHRRSHFNEKNKKWIGWERKRGAIIEFNDLVLGSSDTSFRYSSCKSPPFSKVKYIITLDNDTILPMGMAKKMIGTMAHPLNRPVIDKEKGVVVDGYGLMQPRIEVDNESSNKSRFSRIFTGQEGIDPYAYAISDVYQDLFGEGIYTGKGIYDLRVFQSAMKDAIPDNTVLSHDLLEGSYIRTGLVTDLKLVDSYPLRYNSFSARLHRWVRGDWQLIKLLNGKIYNRKGSRIANPLSLLSRWKILDNLRRSLLAPALMILAFLSFSILPGSIYFWLGIFLFTLSFPLIMGVIGELMSLRNEHERIKNYMPIMYGLKALFMQFLLTLIFLPYQAWLMTKAIYVTLVRVFITKKNLLEWVTSDDIEKSQKNTIRAYINDMKASFLEAFLIFILAISFKPESTLLSLFFFIGWVSTPFIAYWISKDFIVLTTKISEDDKHELGRIARKTWRYFEEFTTIHTHYLPPDNYQEDPPRCMALRTSPTNIGLGLMAILSARDFGFIGTHEMMNLTEKTVTTLEGIKKWHGHLYNWYDVLTLRPLQPGYISTIDSGNLLCYLTTLSEGLKAYLDCPILDVQFSNGIRDTLHCAGKEDYAAYYKIFPIDTRTGNISNDLILWNQALNELILGQGLEEIKEGQGHWKTKIDQMLKMFKNDMTLFMPGIDMLEKIPGKLLEKDIDEDINDTIKELIVLLKENCDVNHLTAAYQAEIKCVNKLIDSIQKSGSEEFNETLPWLFELEEILNKVISTTQQFIKRYKALIERIDALSDAMEFLHLYDKKKELFSIGYNIEQFKLTNSNYDLLASESRQTSYICTAKGKIPPSHWYKLGRSLTTMDRYKGLISWTGTMFEYLMPLLIMKSYKNTLLDETYSFVIKSQKKYGNQKRMPWGTSESGFNSLDKNSDYQYKAIGVPWLGLKRGLIEDAVSAPYATFLALMVDPEAAIKNIKRLKAEGLEGPYGFYEAADYTPERLQYDNNRALIKSFMAHHQGMSLVALNNCLHNNIMQRRFHRNPEIRAAQLLLQEKVASNIIYTNTAQKMVVPHKELITKDDSTLRRFLKPDPVLPNAHILSNGNYSIMITDRGTGYSKNKLATLTRWREDSTLDPYGMFFYLRNVETNAIWSAAYAPLNVLPKKYEVAFTTDKATFNRRDGEIETKTEIIVASGDNVEIRRISLKNLSESHCILELTSYFEVVMAPQATDLAHPAFSNLFVETSILRDKQCIIANRRPRAPSENEMWMANAVVIKGSGLEEIQYETDRMQMIGRGNTVKDPISIMQEKPLSNTSGPVLDPVMSIRTKVKIEPYSTIQITFLNAVSENNETLLSTIDKYASPDAVEEAFKLALARSKVESEYLNMNAAEMELYQSMISDILFISPTKRINQALIMGNKKGQSSLWRYGISGDLPIVFVKLNKIDQMAILYEALKAHDYWRLKELRVDLVILSEEEHEYALPLHHLIADFILESQKHDIINKTGDVFILDKNTTPKEDVKLLYATARIILNGDGGTMSEQIKRPQKPLLPGKMAFSGAPLEVIMPKTNELELLYNNGLGGFGQNGGGYVIQLKKGENTPLPWTNVIANPDFGFIVSEAGSGYTWHKNSRENKLTPWSNDEVSDSPGEVIYIGDDETGELWTATAEPIREDEPYTIKHRFGYSLFEHTSHGIKQRMTQHVPVNESVKISILNLKNDSEKMRNLTLTYYIRPVMGVSDQVTGMHIKTSLGASGALLIENPYNEEFHDEICFMDVSVRERSITGDRKEFFGAGDMSSPDSLSNEELSGTMGTGLDPCGAIQVKVTLSPNERKNIVFLLGIAAKQQEVNDITTRFLDEKNAKESLHEVKTFWKEKLDIVQVNTPTLPMNLMLNGWLQYQVISSRLWARSGFYQAGGAFGFRDQLQDCLSIAHIWPEISRSQILLHAKHQFTQGDVQHWWHEPLGKGTRTGFTDDRLWLPYVTAEYIRISGDRQILDEEVSFLEDVELKEFEDERYGMPRVSDTKASLYNHCIRAIEISLKFGEHGLPLMGTGDWNDGMNTVGNKGLGESVWLGWFLISNLEMFIPICKETGDDERAEKYTGIREKIHEAIEKNAWDGNWYRRAYFDNGQPLGSAENIECKIDSIAQSWSVISGAGNPERAIQAMNSLEEFLICRQEGLIKLLTPPFDKSDLEPGYIKGYIPGVRENGGQYTHAAAWVVIAFAKLGDGDKAWELFELINPINHTKDLREYCRYKTEPYVISADVYSESPHSGRGGWTWYTGAAGWMYRAGLEYILGFQKNGDTIIMDPCIPQKWKEYHITYNYHGSTYDIKVKNPDGINKGVKELSLDGVLSTNNVINLSDDGKFHDVEVIMGIWAIKK